MKIKPAEGLKIRDPDLRDFIPEEGRTVPDTPYWRRRVRDHDVELLDADGAKDTKGAEASPASTSSPRASRAAPAAKE